MLRRVRHLRAVDISGHATSCRTGAFGLPAPAKGFHPSVSGAVVRGVGVRDQWHLGASDALSGALKPEMQSQSLRAESITLKGSVSFRRNMSARRGLL